MKDEIYYIILPTIVLVIGTSILFFNKISHAESFSIILGMTYASFLGVYISKKRKRKEEERIEMIMKNQNLYDMEE